MAYQGAARWDASVRVPLLDENSEVRRDVTAQRKVVLRDELEIFGFAKEDCLRVALFRNLHPNLFLKPTQDFQMAQQRQDAVLQERLAGRVRQAEAELLDAAQMAQLRVLPGLQEQPQQESHRVSQQLAFELADVRVDERWSPKQTRTLGRTALQQDVPPGFPEWH